MDNHSKFDKIFNSVVFKMISVLDAIVTVISAFFATEFVGKIVFGTAVLVMMAICILLTFRYNKFLAADKKSQQTAEEMTQKIESQKTTIDLLEQNIHNGIKYTKNEVVVTLDKQQRSYRFEFIKEFEVISENAPKWYSAQFYANKILKSKNESKNYYKNNTIKWNDLKVRANISFCQPDSTEYSNPQSLDIYNISDESNYIPFNIQYITYKNKRKLDIKKGTKVRLKYCYNVSVDLWGSYLNRSISYFSEPTMVKLKYNIGEEFDIKVSVLLGTEGTPIDTNDYSIKNDEENEYAVCTIILKPSPFAKYRIWWDSESYFENDIATEDTADNSQLTKY